MTRRPGSECWRSTKACGAVPCSTACCGGESRAYDPLWRYVKRVHWLTHLGQGARVRFGEYDLGLRSPTRIPSIDELVLHGRKLQISCVSVRGLLVEPGAASIVAILARRTRSRYGRD